jgi:mono/diheme cytochrome c family protein
MPRLRTKRPPRMRQAQGRVRPRQTSNEGALSATISERRPLYHSGRWFALRARMLDPQCAVCDARASTLDHMLGHDDTIAAHCVRVLRIPAAPDWQTRFWEGPFLSLCVSCHGTKTKAETAGRLYEWIRDHMPFRSGD